MYSRSVAMRFRTVAAISAAGVIAIGLLVACVGVRWFLDTSAEAEALIAEVRRYTEDRRERPTHVEEPVEATFGELLSPHLAGLLDAHLRFKAMSDEDMKALKSFLENGAGRLPAEAEAVARDHARDMRGALRATHASVAMPLDGMNFLGDPDDPLMDDGYLRIQAAGRIAGIEMRRLIAAGEHEEAVSVCVDAFALARDAEYGGALVGRMVGVAVISFVRESCAEALDAAALPVKERALRSLLVIRQAERETSEVVLENFAYEELDWFGFLFTEEERQALSPNARKILEVRTRPRRLGEWLGAIDGWPKTRAAIRRYAAACDEPTLRRNARLEQGALRISPEHELNPFPRTVIPDVRRMDDRHRRGRAHLDHVIAAVAADIYRARHGKWPTDFEAIVTAGLLPELPVDRRTGERMSFVRASNSVHIPATPLDIADRANEAPEFEKVLTMTAD